MGVETIVHIVTTALNMGASPESEKARLAGLRAQEILLTKNQSNVTTKDLDALRAVGMDEHDLDVV